MLKALFVAELAALLYGMSLVFSCSSAHGEAMEDLVQGALGVKGQTAMLKYEDFDSPKIECELDGEVHPFCINPYVLGVGRDEGSGGEREHNER